MDGEPWSPALLDWLASDFVEHGYDIKHLIADDPDVARLPDAGRARATAEAPARGYVFAGPEVRRLTRRAVRRRDRLDHRRVERRIRRRRQRAPARRGAIPARRGRSDADLGRRLRPANGGRRRAT